MNCQEPLMDYCELGNFRQDDAHIYVSEDQVEAEYLNVFEIVERFYSIFGMKYSFRLGTRNPENFMGDIETWNRAEDTLKKILEKSGIAYFVQDGDGAFYGPKVDILMKDALRPKLANGYCAVRFPTTQKI